MENGFNFGSIGSCGEAGFYHLTHPQSRIWYVEKLYPDTSLYNIAGISRIMGSVDFSLLQESIRLFIQRNDGIRLHILERDGMALQYVSRYDKESVDFFDFSACADPEEELKLWMDTEVGKAFKLIDSNLFYFALIKISEKESGLFIKFHHIISDGWSINILSEQVYRVYMELLSTGHASEDRPLSYLDFVKSEQQYLNSERFIKDKDFWTNEFRELPQQYFFSENSGTSGKKTTFGLDFSLSQKIKKFISDNSISMNTFFVTLVLLFFYKSYQCTMPVIGTPVLNRSGRKERSIFGMFTSTMPLKFGIEETNTVRQMLEGVNQKIMNCYFHQKYPYDLLVQDIELKKRGYGSLFQVCVNYYNTRLNNEISGLSIENTELYNGRQLYALELIIKDWSDKGSLTLEFACKDGVYEEWQVHLTYECLINIAEQMIANVDEPVWALEVLPASEKKRQIYTFNQTEAAYPKDRTIVELFEEQVEKTPEKAAVYFLDKSLSYSELNRSSNRLAAFLRSRGITRNKVVGLVLRHSPEAVEAILGVIKSGAAYLPIDPDYPADRMEYMLRDSGCGILLTNCASGHGIYFSGEVIDLNCMEYREDTQTNPIHINEPEDLVYVIYTSGSTGQPKGVMIEHRGLVNYIWWARKMYVMDENDAFALYSSLSFDLTVTSVFTPLIGGNSIYIYDDDGQEYVLFRIMKEKKASIVKLTPSHLSLLKDMDNGDSSVKRFIVGGEDLKVSLASAIYKSFGGRIEIYNEYGPTETVVGCMIHKFDPARDTGISVPIGVPADNVQIYLLDNRLKPLPPWNMGEVYISGHGVARGYLNKPVMTGERFLENPFVGGTRMYRTGDLARFLEDGRIVYTGRADKQLKIRGFRIEPGEIEKRILESGMAENVFVTDREDRDGGRYLCAYIVPTDGFELNELRSYLARRLPEYMMPSRFTILDEIPLTGNGKVNEGLLPDVKDCDTAPTEYSAPANAREQRLLEVVSGILNRPDIGMKDHFIYSGGDSIKAIQVAGKLGESGLKIRVKDILSNPVLKDMALNLEYDLASRGYAVCEGHFKPTPILAWFLSQNHKNPNHCNQSVLLDFFGKITPADMGAILDELIKHHDSLRLNYDRQKQEFYYNNAYLDQKSSVPYFDLSGKTGEEQEQKIKILGGMIKSSLDIEHEIPVRACIFDLGERGRKLLFTAHHTVVDSVSWRILVEDLARMFEQKRQGREFALPEKTDSVLRWSEAVRTYALNLGDEERSYWRGVESCGFLFPSDYEGGDDMLSRCGTLKRSLDTGATGRLLGPANKAYGTKPDEIMIAALALAVCDMAGSDEAVVELEGHGREEADDTIDVSRTVGWFTCIYPVVLKSCGQDLPAHIKGIKEQLRKVPGKGMGYSALKYITGELPENSGKRIRFNYLGELDNMPDSGLLAISNMNSGEESDLENNLTALLDINAMVCGQSLRVQAEYSRSRFREDTVCRWMDSFFDRLSGLIDFCCGRKCAEYTPSDFDMVSFSQDELDMFLTDL